MRDGVCPKCASAEVYYSDAGGATHALSAGGGAPLVRLYRDAKWLPDVWMLETAHYLCRSCGYFETYVRDAAELSKLDDCTNWRRVGGPAPTP